MSDNANPSNNWQELLEAAKREPDPLKLAPLLSAVEAAIFLRWQDQEKSAIDLEALARATHVLRALQITKLNFPAWEVRLPPDSISVGSL